MEELARESICLLARSASHADPPRLGSFGAIFIMLKSALGAGLLNFPWAFQKAGGVNIAISVEMVSLVFLISGLVVLGYAASVSRKDSYQDVVREVCGAATGKLCEVCFCFNLFMISVAFLVVVQDQLEKLCVSLYGTVTGSSEALMPYHWYTDQRFALFIVCLLFILPLSIPKEIGIQKYTSVLGTLAATYLCVAVIIKYYLMENHTAELSPEHSQGVGSWGSMFSVVPTICFGFQCHVSSVPVFNSMSRKQMRPWGLVVTVGMIICLFVYTGTGVCGFLSFGSEVKQDVLMSYPSDDIAIAIARAFIVVCVVTSYPILHFCGRAVVEGLWLRCRGEQVELCVVRERRRRILQTVVWFSSTLALALFIPDIGKVISLIGGLAACFIFVFPGLCLIQAKLSESDDRSASWYVLVVYGVVMVTIGAFVFGLTTSNSVYQDIVS
uniref:Amino acid transporter transmembrane domain-containing protein n=1 Tax=Gadus morhua TaxID=8049 RepID=A0A8C5BFD7_GADMO